MVRRSARRWSPWPSAPACRSPPCRACSTGSPPPTTCASGSSRPRSSSAYVPDAFARSLKIGRTEQIAFAVADVGNPVYVRMMHAVSSVLSAAGFRLVLSSTGNDPDEQLDVVRNANRGFADGLIVVPLRLTPALLDELSTTRLPVAVIGSLPDGMHLDNVRADSAAGVGLAMDHLHANGPAPHRLRQRSGRHRARHQSPRRLPRRRRPPRARHERRDAGAGRRLHLRRRARRARRHCSTRPTPTRSSAPTTCSRSPP